MLWYIAYSTYKTLSNESGTRLRGYAGPVKIYALVRLHRCRQYGKRTYELYANLHALGRRGRTIRRYMHKNAYAQNKQKFAVRLLRYRPHKQTHTHKHTYQQVMVYDTKRRLSNTTSSSSSTRATWLHEAYKSGA